MYLLGPYKVGENLSSTDVTHGHVRPAVHSCTSASDRSRKVDRERRV